PDAQGPAAALDPAGRPRPRGVRASGPDGGGGRTGLPAFAAVAGGPRARQGQSPAAQTSGQAGRAGPLASRPTVRVDEQETLEPVAAGTGAATGRLPDPASGLPPA